MAQRKGELPKNKLEEYETLMDIAKILNELGNIASGRGETNNATILWRLDRQYRNKANDLRANIPAEEYLLMAERMDGTGRMVYESSHDREALEASAVKRTTARTRYWVEPAGKDGK